MNQPALFLDRDGVLNVDHGYVFRVEDYDLFPDVLDALRLAAARGYALIIVTNQSGIGRGYFTQDDYDTLEADIIRRFAAEGITITATYHCPHHPEMGCHCRKPLPGMILRAAREHAIDLGRSAMIGDKPSDAEAAQAAGIGTIELVSPDRQIGAIVASLRDWS